MWSVCPRLPRYLPLYWLISNSHCPVQSLLFLLIHTHVHTHARTHTRTHAQTPPKVFFLSHLYLSLLIRLRLAPVLASSLHPSINLSLPLSHTKSMFTRQPCPKNGKVSPFAFFEKLHVQTTALSKPSPFARIREKTTKKRCIMHVSIRARPPYKQIRVNGGAVGFLDKKHKDVYISQIISMLYALRGVSSYSESRELDVENDSLSKSCENSRSSSRFCLHFSVNKYRDVPNVI